MIVDNKDRNKKSTKKKNNFIRIEKMEKGKKQRRMAATNKMFNSKDILRTLGMERRC